MNVPIELIHPSPYQPRLNFEIEELKKEIEKDGLLSALVVRKKDDYYELLDGERRLRALKELGWKTVPIDVREVDDRTARRSVFKLNKIRENYTVEEEARYYKKLTDEGMTAWEISEELGVKYNWVLANLNIFKFPEDVQKIVFTPGRELTVSHIVELEHVIARNRDNAIAWVRTILDRKLKSDDVHKIVQEQEAAAIKKALEEERLTKAQAELPVREFKLETPEDYEKAAKVLQREARRKAQAVMSPEERAAQEVARAEERRRKAEERKRREDEERRFLEEEAMERARAELSKDRGFILESARKLQLPFDIRLPRKAREEIERKEGIIYTIGDYDCPNCGRHWSIKCDGKRHWEE